MSEKWKKGFEIISSNVRVDASDGGGDEAEQCKCSNPKSSDGGKGKCCFDDNCFNFATQTECIDCWPGDCLWLKLFKAYLN
jgi:hypothetical protein